MDDPLEVSRSRMCELVKLCGDKTQPGARIQLPTYDPKVKPPSGPEPVFEHHKEWDTYMEVWAKAQFGLVEVRWWAQQGH